MVRTTKSAGERDAKLRVSSGLAQPQALQRGARLTRNQVPACRLRVRVPRPPLLMPYTTSSCVRLVFWGENARSARGHLLGRIIADGSPVSGVLSRFLRTGRAKVFTTFRFQLLTCREADQNVGQHAVLFLIPDRTDPQVAFVDPKRRLGLGQLAVRLPQVFGRPVGDVGTEQVTALVERGPVSPLFVFYPGISIWALNGLRKLLENNGRFTLPESTQVELDQLLTDSAPRQSLVEQCCQVDLKKAVRTVALYDIHREWQRTIHWHEMAVA